MTTTIQPVLLSGGAGSRLWPLSREHYPKQLLPLASERSLLQETLGRLDGLAAGGDIEVAAPIVVCNEEHRFLVAEHARLIDKVPAAIILEPVGRSTAPAMTLAALFSAAQGDDSAMVVMPADHVIADLPAFHAAIRQGAKLAADGAFVTFGVVPRSAIPAYGYIEADAAPVKAGAGARRVLAFTEKPDAATAARYVASGDYLWNSGIFMVRPSVWMAAVERLAPPIAAHCREAYEGGHQDGEFNRVEARAFEACPSDSIDYAVLEKLAAEPHSEIPLYVVSLDAGWSDVGAFPALWEVNERDSEGNVVKGDVYTLNTRNSMVVSGHRLVAAIGLDDVVVIETADAVMVAHKDHAEQVRDVVATMRGHKRDEYLAHRRVYRPWGHYEGVDKGEGFQVKHITVRPGAALSLQMHRHRAEHWIVVRGTARVTRGEDVFELRANESTFIPVGTKHRLENPGTEPLEIIEVQSGDYLGEDDIVRFEDRYGRGSSE